MSKPKNTAKKEEPPAAALVPKLRFPEFRGAEGWELTTIGNLGRFYYGKSAPKWSLAEDAPTPCVRYGELYTKFGPVIAETYSRTKIAPEMLRFSKGKEILIPRVGEKPEDFGKCCCYLTLKNIAIGEMISVFETEQIPLFYTYYFRKIYKQFAKVVEGQNVKNLYYVELEPLPICRPSISEQQKIAECLSSVDEVIAAQGRKVDELKTHKKGLMQQLFPREGETQPRLRFPEFRKTGDWDSKPFEEFVTKSFYGTSSSTSPAGKYPVLRMGNMVDGSIDFINLVYLDLDADSFESFRLEDGDILLNRTNSPALVGKISLFQLSTDCITASYIVTYRLNKKQLNPSFCNFMLNTPHYQLRIKAFAKPSISQANINPTTFKKELIIAVPSLPEQQRIADCLGSLDARIQAETAKLEALKVHKQALMQQLFPSTSEPR